jgi:hypothetical protein
MAGMREAGPGKFEYQVQAAIEQIYLKNGAMSWSYRRLSRADRTPPRCTTRRPCERWRPRSPARRRGADYQDVGRHHADVSVSGTFTDGRKTSTESSGRQDAGIKPHRRPSHPEIEVAVEEVVEPGS